MTSCLSNCSNNGVCKFDLDNNKFMCDCDQFFAGIACQIDSRPCSSDSCLNNATCIDFSNSYNYNMSLSSNTSYNCLCNKLYEGSNCEFKIDMCKNETCSGNGNCVEVNNKPTCECFSMFDGDKCEITSNELKIIKSIISLASITAIVTVVVFYLTIILMDITKYLLRNKRNRIKNKKNIKRS